MNQREEVLRLHHIEKSYGRQSVLEVDELRFCRGDRVMVSGANGSGKTTLLKILARIIPPDRGEVWWAPCLQKQAPVFVPQIGGLYGDMTLEDNLTLYRRLYGLRRVDYRGERHVWDLGLGPFLGLRFDDLSGGYKRLAMLAAALHANPYWILLDEPFNGVDSERRDVLVRYLTQDHRNADLLVMSSQERDPVLTATRFLQVARGRVKCLEA